MNLDLSKVKKVRMVIFQPRLKSEPTCPEWECGLDTLYDFAEEAKRAVVKAEEALKYSDPVYLYEDGISWERDYLKPSEKGCAWCKAKAKCPAIAQECLQGVLAPATTDGLYDLDDLTHANSVDCEPDLKQAVAVATKQVALLDFKTLARVYAAKDLFKNWLDAVEDRMLSEMLQGEKHTDWKLVKGRPGNRKWKDADEVEVTMKSMRLKLDEMYDKSIKSPTEMEKLLKKRPRVWNKLQPLIGRSDGETHVAPMSDKRPSINPHDDDLAAMPDYSKTTLAGLLGVDTLDDLI